MDAVSFQVVPGACKPLPFPQLELSLTNYINPRSCLVRVQMKVKNPPALLHTGKDQSRQGTDFPAHLLDHPCPPRPTQCKGSVGTML